MNQYTNGKQTDRRKLAERRTLLERRLLSERRKLNLPKPGGRTVMAEPDSSPDPDWTGQTRDEYELARQEFKELLRAEAIRMARTQQSNVVTDANVRLANQNLLLGKQQSSLIRTARISAIVLIVVGSYTMDSGFESNSIGLIAAGAMIVLVLTIFQEVLLHLNR